MKISQSFKYALLFACFLLVSQSVTAIPAFPGAEGFGAETIGGRGGVVIPVTNLNDSGPGSLRRAVNTSGPRIVVFQVSGTIELDQGIKIQHPYLTIAGQTAPGDGITLKNRGNNNETPFQIDATHDIVIRHIRSRPGSSTTDGQDGGLDGFTIVNSSNVILDHVSVSWASDEGISISADSQNITVQWSVAAEALNCANHHKTIHPEIHQSYGNCPSGGKPHSMGLLVRSGNPEEPDPELNPEEDPNFGWEAHKHPKNISIHHNLIMNNNRRNPQLTSESNIDFVNNVIYNPGEVGLTFKKVANPMHVNLVNNYIKAGPDTNFLSGTEGVFGDAAYGITIFSGVRQIDLDNGWVGPSGLYIYEQGTQLDGLVALHRPIWLNGWRSPTRFPAAPITETSAGQAYQDVIAKVGATLPKRDLVDNRLIQELQTGSGQLIDQPSEVGGWPTLQSAPSLPDSDGDGMPTSWEQLYGFLPNNGGDGAMDFDGDGYTNIEEYLNNTNAKTNHPDLNNDGVVDVFDLVVVGTNFNSSTPTNFRADVNEDAVVNIADLGIITQHFGNTY